MSVAAAGLLRVAVVDADVEANVAAVVEAMIPVNNHGSLVLLAADVSVAAVAVEAVAPNERYASWQQTILKTLKEDLTRALSGYMRYPQTLVLPVAPGRQAGH